MFVQIFLVLGVSKLNPMKHQWRVDEFQPALNKKHCPFRCFTVRYVECCELTVSGRKKRSRVGSVQHIHTSCLLLGVGKCSGDPSESV